MSARFAAATAPGKRRRPGSEASRPNFAPNRRVSAATSNEHDCSGAFPCANIDYGNQTGDDEGVATYGGTAHAIWTDSSRNQGAAICGPKGEMEEVFSAAIKE